MSKKKIIIITVIILVFIIAVLIFIGLRNINNDEVEEVPIENETRTSQQNTNNNNNTNTSNTNEEENTPSEDLPQMSQEEYDEFMLYSNLTSNRSLNASPSYKFKSDSFETVPKDPEWFTTYIASELSGGPVVKDLYNYINSIEVYNLPDTKTNFIVVDMDGHIYIYEMYKTEYDETMKYEKFNTDGKDDAYIKLISKKGKKIFSKKNPDSLDIGQW